MATPEKESFFSRAIEESEKGLKQEYLDRKQEYLNRKQESGEDTREYYNDMGKVWLQAYALDKRSLVKFRDEMLKCRVEGDMPVLKPKKPQ